MRYAKLVNENEIKELNPRYLEIDGKIYTNPLSNSMVDLAKLGYKEFVVDEMPQVSRYEKVVRYYQVKDNKIHRSWRVEQMTAEEIAEREMEYGI